MAKYINYRRVGEVRRIEEKDAWTAEVEAFAQAMKATIAEKHIAEKVQRPSRIREPIPTIGKTWCME